MCSARSAASSPTPDNKEEFNLDNHCRPVPLEHEMRKAALLEPVTHRQPGLAAADDECLDVLNRHGGESCR
jgi:hypothetical protein